MEKLSISSDNSDIVEDRNYVSKIRPRILIPTPVALAPALVAALQRFAATERRDFELTEWYRLCMQPHIADVFFVGPRKSQLVRRTVSEAVSDVYLELLSTRDNDVLRPKFVYKLREQVSQIRASLPAPRHLPAEANTTAFRAGLDALCIWELPVCSPQTSSGDPLRRSATLQLARKFADSFSQIPVDYIHYLICLGWPSASVSSTRRVLTSAVTTRIKAESEEFRKRDQGARAATTLAIQAAATSRYALSPADQVTIDNLNEQIDRIRGGKRRFTTDAARLRAIEEISASMDDRDLANEYLHFIDLSKVAFKD
jgi:hypothetical protein